MTNRACRVSWLLTSVEIMTCFVSPSYCRKSTPDTHRQNLTELSQQEKYWLVNPGVEKNKLYTNKLKKIENVILASKYI